MRSKFRERLRLLHSRLSSPTEYEQNILVVLTLSHLPVVLLFISCLFAFGYADTLLMASAKEQVV